jgi:2-keto-4-pentenoate hydratase
MSDETGRVIASRRVISFFTHDRILISIHYLRFARLAIKLFGLVNNRARLFRSEIHESSCTLRHAVYNNLAIEGEMALRIGDDGDIVAAFPVIELHHFVFRAPKKTLAELIANNGINAGAVVPRNNEVMLLEHWRDAKTQSVLINGTTIDTGALWAMPGGATEALRWLRNVLSALAKP